MPRDLPPAPVVRGRPPKTGGVARSLCWRFLLERGPDFRGTRRRLDSLLADFLAFAAATPPGWHLSIKTPRDFLALLRSTRRAFLKTCEKRAVYDAARKRASERRASARAIREAARKR